MPESEQSTPLVQTRIPVYPRSVKGRFRNIKTAILVLAYSVYFLLPWLPWARDNGPDQAVLFDIVGRKFYIFNLVVYAQDIFWLAGFLIIAAFLLFFVTGIAGRVFCGYFCFQTLWTEVFIFIERLVQGERNQRMKLANAPWDARKLFLIGSTWLLWVLVGFITGLSFTLYWGQAGDLVVSFFSGTAPFPAYATTLFLTLTTFVMAGIAREQVCTYMCPYARFQSAMFDSSTLVISYDAGRGERECGRCKPDKVNQARDYRRDHQLGDCIDCGYCVQVCPVGIDIRNGLQYQCISCALCIDACDTVMDAIKYPRGLIRYTSESGDKGGWRYWLSVKNVGYALALFISTGILIYSIASRAELEVHVEQLRQPLYVVQSDGRIQNRYKVKIVNKSTHKMTYRIAINNFPSAQLDVRPSSMISVEPGRHVVVQARVTASQSELNVQHKFHFVLTPTQPESGPLQEPATFFSPR